MHGNEGIDRMAYTEIRPARPEDRDAVLGLGRLYRIYLG